MKKFFLVFISILTSNILLAQEPFATIAANGIFVFFGNEIPKTFEYKLERKSSEDADFKTISSIGFPTRAQEFEGKLLMMNASCPYYFSPNEKQISSSWNKFFTSSITDSVSFYNSIPIYLYASGNAYLDVNVKAGVDYTYRVSRLYSDNANGKTLPPITFKLKGIVCKPKYYSKRVDGTSLSIKWLLKCRDEKNKPHNFKVFRSDNLQTPLRALDCFTGFVNKNDSLFAMIVDTMVSENFYYDYYISLFDRFGNPAPNSDTIRVQNIFSATLPITHLAVKSDDKLKGIRLSWKHKPVKNLRSVDIYKSEDFSTNFKMISSALPKDSTYLDLDVKPLNTYYYYVVLNGLFEHSLPSAKISGMLQNSHVPLPPQHIRAVDVKNKIKLSWTKIDPSTRGYYLFRGNNYHPKQMQLVSGLILSDSLNVVYTDTSRDIRPARLYAYVVKAVSNNYVIGASSLDTAFVSTTADLLHGELQAPSEIHITSINGLARIVWNSRQTDDGISDFEIYRREKNATDKKMNEWKLLKKLSNFPKRTAYTDSTVLPMVHYEYALKAIYFGQEESNFSLSEPFDLPLDRPLPPAAIRAVNAENSIYLEWDDSGMANLKSYQIFRSEGKQKSVLIKTIDAKENFYTDKNIKSKSEYFYYMISIDKNNIRSSNSSEVGISTP